MTDSLLWKWSTWRWQRWLLLAGLLMVALYLNAVDVGPRVAVPYFAAVAAILPVLLLAAFIHGRDIATASAVRLEAQQRFVSDARSDIDRSVYRHASLALGVKTQVPPEWMKKLEDLDALRTRLDEAEAGLEEDEERLQEFGEGWAALLICIVEVAAVGEAAALIPLASPTPVLPPALLSGAAVAIVLVLVTWAVVLLVRFATQPVIPDGDEND